MKTILVLVVILVSLASAGCTFVGAGIGAAVPRYEERPSQPGEDIDIVLLDGRTVSGTVVGRDGGEVSVSIDKGTVVWADDVPRRRVGTRVWTGLVIGATLDAIALTALYTALIVMAGGVIPAF